ncbi:zinc finger CCCH domain-containing protein 6 isoform X2 [Mercurialis annua]|uniref:zinc finger CCCH domain-containing protein 6 isoform X2 n=1 Tax=Mercurialis annua TaxID=3986 RepID=UPI00215F3C9A|nr:zinc finger CCCH domain-containing protein 6 isoform X2 [Mercurialis annua]
MKRSTGKSNRVTWAPAYNLCQMRLFLSEDSPLKVGTQIQDHLQKKTSQMLHHLTSMEMNDLPPGFEGGQLNPVKEASSHIPMIEWKCSPKVILSQNWHVAAGEESSEAEAQKVREMRVLEAVFPRRASIPPCPVISVDVEEEFYNDSFTPVIPITPIEDGAVADKPTVLSEHTQVAEALPKDLLSSPTPKCNSPPASEKPMIGLLPGISADLTTAAASAALTALVKSMEKGSLIDTGLLIKILRDPKMIEKLIHEPAPISTSSSATMLVPKQTDGNSHHIPTRLLPKLEPITRSTPGTGRKPMMLSAPMSVLQPPGSGMQPTVSRLPPQKDTKLDATMLVSKPTDGNSHHIPTGLLPKLEPMTRSTPGTGHKPMMLSAPMPVSQPPNSGVQPTVSRPPPQPATKPVPLIYLSRQESINHSVSRPAATPNMYISSTGNTMSTKPAQPAPKSYFEEKHNQLPPTLGMPKQPNGYAQANLAAINTKPVKDINYFKNLIREHGSDNTNQNIAYNGNHTLNHEFGNNLRTYKLQQPCMYLRGPNGCRNGYSCPYQHDSSFQFQTGGYMEGRYAKRMKFDMGGYN